MGSNPAGRSRLDAMKSFSELLKRIDNARNRIGISEHPAWYRGHSDTSYRLLPSLLRLERGLKHERNLYAVFRTQAGSLISRDSNSWSTLAMMQHHGTPTRLLDWSESLDVALFFAICEDKKHPCIWILNPYRLNLISYGKNLIFDDADLIPFDYYTTVRDEVWPYDLPLACAAPWTSERIKRQRGCFTIHGSRSIPMEDMKPPDDVLARISGVNKDLVKRVDIPTHLLPEIRDYFKKKNFGFFEVYPDLPGLSLSLIRQFSLHR